MKILLLPYYLVMMGIGAAIAVISSVLKFMFIATALICMLITDMFTQDKTDARTGGSMFGLFKKKEPITYNLNIVDTGGHIQQRKVKVSSDFKARLSAREFAREVTENNQVDMVVHSITTEIGKADNGWTQYRELEL